MSNPMKYIKELEAAGFARNQAEAQVQMVLDALEGDLVTKGEFALFSEQMENRFTEVKHQFVEVGHRFSEFELRLVVKLSLVMVTVATIATGILSWLIKLR